MKFAPINKLLIVVVFLLCNSTFAAPSPPEPIPPVPPGFPIDNGLIFFILLTIGYAFYILKFKKKASN